MVFKTINIINEVSKIIMLIHMYIAFNSSLTWFLAVIGRYFCRERSFLNFPKGSKITSCLIWENKVDEILHNLCLSCPRDLFSSNFLSTIFLTSSVYTTSWKPAKHSPPVRYSNCFPACNNKHPFGTTTFLFSPFLSQIYKPP